MTVKIVTIKDKKEERFLRKKTADFDFDRFSKKEVHDLIIKMKNAMDEAEGIGLAANQIGLDMNVFVARVDGKFYSIFNPKIIKRSKEISGMEEGCLSVPDFRDEAFRNEKITLEGFDKNNKKVKIKAWGLLACVFQHEVDHLNGKLFIDRTKAPK
ncbi:MAG TPA: peptide deformylase [Candidatus Paceibacterota bacterium]